MNRRGLHKPLWDTEIGWDFNYHLPKSYDQAAFVSRIYVLHWLYGVNRAYWDMYDGSSGTLYNGHLTPAGQAYVVMSNWMVGSSMDSCAQYSNGTWACHLVRSNGHNAWILWNVNGSNSFAPVAAWGLHAQFDLYGGTRSISPTTSVPIAPLPVMVEGGVAERAGSSTATAEFSVSADPTSMTVPAGQVARFNVTLTPDAGFTQTATLACAGAPPGNTCIPSADAIKFDGTSPATVQFAVSTGGNTLSASLLPTAPGLALLMATIVLLPFALERKQALPRAARIAARAGLMAILAVVLASCGGSLDARSKQVTVAPAGGSYTLVFSATAGKLTNATTVKLNVR